MSRNDGVKSLPDTGKTRKELDDLLHKGGASGVIVFKDYPEEVKVRVYIFKNDSAIADASVVAFSAIGLYSIMAQFTMEELIDSVHPEIMSQITGEESSDGMGSPEMVLDADTPVKGRA